MNPNATIYVVLHTPENYANLENSDDLQILREYPNVKFRYVNINEFSKNTPLEMWISSGSLSNSNYVVSHTSDVLRYLLLNRFPGLYLDMDVIAMSPYGQINLDNFACAESDEYLNGAVLKLSGRSGRKFAENFLM
jgi:lactosylceramide 4-alpha-galactosyltransferase